MTPVLDRRTLIKGAAVTAGGVWAAPYISTVGASAATASPVHGQLPHVCCQCYDAKGVFIAAAINHFSDAGCKEVCEKAVLGDTSGTFLRFTSSTSFTAVDPTHTPNGCFWNGKVLGGTFNTCPATPPLVTCDEGSWP
jgi:hypothetical protein